MFFLVLFEDIIVINIEAQLILTYYVPLWIFAILTLHQEAKTFLSICSASSFVKNVEEFQMLQTHRLGNNFSLKGKMCFFLTVMYLFGNLTKIFESSAVNKILSLSEITKKSSSPHIINYHIKSFPTMSDTQGQRNALVDKFEQYC